MCIISQFLAEDLFMLEGKISRQIWALEFGDGNPFGRHANQMGTN